MLENRRFVILGVLGLVGILYIFRLFYLQVLDESYSISASSNSIKRIVDVPVRGQIYDRSGKLIVYNSMVYDLVVTPSKARIPDTTALCHLLGMEKAEFDSVLAVASKYSRVKPYPLLRQLSKEEHAGIQDILVNYSGFEFVKSSVRTYTSATMANALGYVSEIGAKQLENQEEKYYRSGDYIGQTGLERFYEKELRGQRGVKFVMQNASGVNKGSWKNGELDTVGVAGKNLYTGIDLLIQQFADSLLVDKVGSVVAIEPKTGQILAIASAPTYDPRQLTNRGFSKSIAKLNRNPYKPMFNRPVMASYRPGSTFKTLQALIALQMGAITPNSGFGHGGVPMGCHGHPATPTVASGIRNSCNPYFYNVFRRVIYHNGNKNTFKASQIGLAEWGNYATQFGIGRTLGIDQPSEYKGLLPGQSTYDKAYGANQWKFSNFASVSIGEGEVLITPIKIANLAATIANKGYYYTPHIVARIGDNGQPRPEYLEKHVVDIDRRYFDIVLEGMYGASNGGTTRAYEHVKGITIAGKTGTSQNGKRKDSSIYMAIAPLEDPKIAIAVFVENAGSGGSAAAPIAHLLIERYLKRKTENTALANRFLSLNLLYPIVESKSSKTNTRNKPGTRIPRMRRENGQPIWWPAQQFTIPKSI